MFAALAAFGTMARGEYESAWPDYPRIAGIVDDQARSRRIAASRARALPSGRLPGESELDQWKREADNEGPDEAMRGRISALAAKLALRDRKPTQAPPTSTPLVAPPSVSVGDMQPDECDALVTLLETMSFESLQSAIRATGTIQCAEDQAAVARAFRALWQSKGKEARNLLVLVKGEKTA